ncbi:MAG: hypothetical protein QOG21_933 [Actinomycetota bacterium]|jgi:hypothetical protein|nr:hypothetical protein [Actinomycetota bacterium]
MLKRVGYGVASGAVGTTALNLTTYLDMAWRGRGASELPAQAAVILGRKLGLQVPDEGDETAQNRKSAAGSLLGFATGLGMGAVYGSVRSANSHLATVAAGTIVGLGAMAATDLPLAALGLTDPRDWDARSWASDLVPHLVYGLCTALAFEALTA